MTQKDYGPWLSAAGYLAKWLSSSGSPGAIPGPQLDEGASPNIHGR